MSWSIASTVSVTSIPRSEFGFVRSATNRWIALFTETSGSDPVPGQAALIDRSGDSLAILDTRNVADPEIPTDAPAVYDEIQDFVVTAWPDTPSSPVVGFYNCSPNLGGGGIDVPGQRIVARVVDTTGDVLTPGTPIGVFDATVSVNLAAIIALQAIDSTRSVIVWGTYVAAGVFVDIYAAILTRSGSTLSVGTPTIIFPSASNFQTFLGTGPRGLTPVPGNANMLMKSYEDTSDSTSHVFFLDVSGASVSLVADVALSIGYGYAPGLASLAGSDFLMTFPGGPFGLYGYAVGRVGSGPSVTTGAITNDIAQGIGGGAVPTGTNAGLFGPVQNFVALSFTYDNTTLALTSLVDDTGASGFRAATQTQPLDAFHIVRYEGGDTTALPFSLWISSDAPRGRIRIGSLSVR